MTRIDFYIIPEIQDVGPVPVCCRLCERAVSADQRVYIHAPDGSLIEDIDSALWTFKDDGFLAHDIVGADVNTALAPIILGRVSPPDDLHDVLINLGNEIPTFFSRFERVLEIVSGDAEQRAQARTRYQFYRDRGYTIESHKLG